MRLSQVATAVASLGVVVVVAAVFVMGSRSFPVLAQEAAHGKSNNDLPAVEKVGDKAHDFELPVVNNAGDKPAQLTLKKCLEQGPVVLMMLRGFPGYQCPLCSKQVLSFTDQAKKFEALGARVLMVYPGEKEGLMDRAREFLDNAEFPQPFTLMIDPDYEFTKNYGLRWEADGETSYPSTFVINKEGTVTFAKISRSHGDRAEVADVLSALEKTSAE